MAGTAKHTTYRAYALIDQILTYRLGASLICPGDLWTRWGTSSRYHFSFCSGVDIGESPHPMSQIVGNHGLLCVWLPTVKTVRLRNIEFTLTTTHYAILVLSFTPKQLCSQPTSPQTINGLNLRELIYFKCNRQVQWEVFLHLNIIVIYHK